MAKPKGMAPLGIFEPLRQLVAQHGDQLQTKLSGMRESLSAIQSNTQAQLMRDIRMRRSVFVPASVEEGESVKEGRAELRNDSAYGWRVRWASAYGIRATVFIGVESPEGFLIDIDSTPSAYPVDWYIPVNSVLFVQNPSDGEGSFSMEIEMLYSEAAEGYTGPSGEAIEVERREQLPPTAPFSPIS